MTRRGYALRVLGASLMLVALVFWYLESLQHRQTAASAFRIAIFTDAPQAIADPVLLLQDGGNRIDVRLLSTVDAHGTIVVPHEQHCGTTSPSAPSEYDAYDVDLKANTVVVINCAPNRPPRSITFTRRELTLGMIRPALIPPTLTQRRTPAHQLRVAFSQNAVDAAEFQGGLTEAVIPNSVRMPDGDDETNARYLSRYGAAFDPSAVITWTDYRAEVAWAIGLIALAVLIVLFGNAAYALFRPDFEAAT